MFTQIDFVPQKIPQSSNTERALECNQFRCQLIIALAQFDLWCFYGFN